MCSSAIGVLHNTTKGHSMYICDLYQYDAHVCILHDIQMSSHDEQEWEEVCRYEDHTEDFADLHASIREKIREKPPLLLSIVLTDIADWIEMLPTSASFRPSIIQHWWSNKEEWENKLPYDPSLADIAADVDKLMLTLHECNIDVKAIDTLFVIYKLLSTVVEKQRNIAEEVKTQSNLMKICGTVALFYVTAFAVAISAL